MSFGPPPSIYTESARTAEHTRTRRRRLALGGSVTAALLALCLGGTTLWFADHGDDAHSPATKADHQLPDAVRDTLERPPVSPEGQLVAEHQEGKLSKWPRYAPGLWATRKTVAQGIGDRVDGYEIKPDNEKRAWTLRLPGNICATTGEVTADGRAAVMAESAPAKGSSAGGGGACDELVFFDIDTGKRLWQNKLPAADFAARTNTNLALTEGVVAVAWGQGSAAYDMGSGRRLWNTTTTSQCHDMGYAGGRALLALVNCGDPRQPRYRVEKLDARTGKARWTYRLASGVQAVYLPSSDPPVLAVAAGDTEVTDLITLDGKNGTRMATISMNGYDPECDPVDFGAPYFGMVTRCDTLVVGPHLIFVTSQENIANGQPIDWIVAFDPRTGHSVAKFEGRELQKVIPIRISGDNLILYRAEGFANPAAVVSWNPRTDKETPYLLFEVPGTGDWRPSNPGETRIVYEQGHIFFSQRTLRADDESPKDPVSSLFGIGSAGLKH